jgi:uncharacterized membrane protein YsdA (DUF1294 family)
MYLHYAVCILGAWNVIVFLLYGVDKRKAKKGKRRISERTLLITAFFMGGIGAFFGMVLFKHKTKHWKFKILLPLYAVFNIAIAAVAYYFCPTL